MQRFSDLYDDFYISDIAEHAKELASLTPQMLERITLLQAALNEIAARGCDDEGIPEQSHGYIPLDLSEFLSTMFALENALSIDVDYRHSELRHRPCSFLEIGCGTGRNVHLLRCTDRFGFDKVQGFDISADMIAKGHARYGLDVDLFVADCMTFDYSGYDIVYFYRPLSDDDAEAAFEARVVDTLKSGAFIVGAGSTTLDDNRRVIVKDDRWAIYKKL